MARDLFQEAGFDPSSEDSGRDLFEEAGLTSGQDGKERKKRKSQATAADYLRAMDSGLAQGVAGIAGGIGTFIQDPAANALSGVSGAAAAADRGITWAANAISGKDISKENEAIQENARMASRFAAESRDAQAADPSNLPARFGRMLQRDSERANAEILASDKANNPELIAQQQNTAEAQGFVDNLAAIKDNPLAFAHTMARSAPDMAAGVGVGSVVHRAGASLGRVSTAGALSEASSSALQSRQGVYQQVNEMPLEMLAKSPRFQAVLAETQGDPAKAREILANELADQVPLLAGAGTALGTVLTNKLFGGDATAKTIAGVERMGIREFGKRVLQDTAEEGFQGVPEDAVQYGASVQADPSQQYDPGGSAAQNLAAGFAMGSGGHGLGYARDTFRGSNVQNQTPAENQQNQAPALSGQAQAATNSGAAAGVAAGRGSAGLEAVGVGDTAAAEEALKTPVQLTALDRADALGGELQAITERQQELAPENGYGPAFDGERQDLATKAAELAAERESITATWPKAERGAMSSFTTEAGARLEAQYALMDAGDLVTSHDEGLAVNPLFPKELQPRDRSRQASELQVSGIVQRLDPARLGLSADAANGAPIVGADGLVESGNARTIALKRVYQANGQKAENYKQFLRDNAAQFGLAPEAIDAMAKPVLVRVRATPVNRAEFARQANASTVQRMSPSEQALSDAKRLNSLDGLNPDEQGDFGNNMDFVRQFMATLPVTEQSDLIESDGRLSTAGYRRIQNAVLARAYGDSPSLRRMTESMDNNLANISKALVRVAPTIASARERMDAGTLHQADIAPDLLAAVEGLSALKEKGWKVADELGQADLTGPKYSPEAAELLTFLSENARSPRRIAEFFQNYYQALEQAGDPTQPSMFGDEGPAPTRAGLLRTARGEPAPAQNFDFSTVEQALTEERDASTNEIEDGWIRGGERRGQTPVERAIERAVNSTMLDAVNAREVFDVAVQAGRLDVAEYAVQRAENYAKSMGTTPGVSKDSPKYEAIKQDLEHRKAEAIAQAAALRQDLNAQNKQGAKNADTDQNAQRGVAGEGAQADARDGGQPQNAPRSEGRNQGNGPAQADAAGRQPGKPAQEAANDAVGEWVHFPEDSGTLGIPRSDMPQVKGEHRGALVNFLNARGISSTKDEVPAASLKPTQAEFSREKTERFMKTGPIGERSVLVSSDGHVLDGHHQWMAMKALGESIPVIRLDAPIRQLLDEVREFPSVQQSDGDKSLKSQRAAAVQDFKDALGDLAQIATKHTRAMMVPESTPGLMPALVKLYDAAVRLLGTDAKVAKRWVVQELRKDARFKTFWNKIDDRLHKKAALQAMEAMDKPAQGGLFYSPEAASDALQGDLFAQPAAEAEKPTPEGVALDLDGVVIRRGKGFIKGKFLAEVDGQGVPNTDKHKGPFNTEQEAYAAALDWRETLASRAADAKNAQALRGQLAEKLKAGESPSDADLRLVDLRPGTSDVRWFFSRAADLFGLTSRQIRPLVADLIRIRRSDMGTAYEYVPTKKALMAIAASASNAAPKVATINGNPYDLKRDNYVPPKVAAFMPADALAAADKVLGENLLRGAHAPALSAADRARAEALLAPVLAKAAEAKPDYDQKIIDIAQEVGALGQLLAPLKGLKRGAEKLAEEGFDVSGMKDLLRSTIVVRSYDDAQAVMDAIEREFKLLRTPKNRTGAAPLRAQGKDVPAEDPAKYAGYSDIMVNVVLPNGTIAEIQINTPEMLSAKSGQGHALYEVLREEPKSSAKAAAINAASVEFYNVAREAAKKSASEIFDQRTGHRPAGSMPSQGDFSSSTNRLPSGNSTYISSTPSPSVKSIPKTQPSGNLSGTFIEDPFAPIVVEGLTNSYNSSTAQGGKDANAQPGQGGAQAQGASPAQKPGGKRPTQSVRDGSGRSNAVGDQLSDDGGPGPRQMGPATANGTSRQDEHGQGDQPRKGDGRNAGVPAGRDIPPKTGRNYAFGDGDLTYAGSWTKKAEQNVEAVELLQKLQTEGRDATRAEQGVLAKFIGWGASEIANNLFGPKLEKAAAALQDYDVAIEKLAGRESISNSIYSEYQPAFRVLQHRNPALNWYTTGPITRAMLDKAKPDASTQQWVSLQARLKAAMSAKDWAEAARSTQYAHYTSKAVVKSMWRAMERMGFKGGSILEPGAGIGVFPGLMPADMAANSVYTGIEFDSLTGGVLKQLFPDERILVESFVDSKLPKDFYDVAVGNPPFSSTKILSDPEYAKKALSLHDYFFAKSIDRVKPGGLVVYITSRYTMDKASDKARGYLSERADLVGAIRLPQTAFQANAGTEVVTDVIFLRKKVPGETFQGAQTWAGLAPANGADGHPLMVSAGQDKDGTSRGDKPAMINEYFAAHPEMVLGTHGNTGSMYSDKEYTVEPLAGDIEAHFAAAVDKLPADIYKPGRGTSAEAAKVREIDFNPKAKKEGNYYLTDAGQLMVREGGVGVRVELKSPKDAEIIKGFVPLRDALKQAHYDQLNNGDWETSLKALQGAYATFTKAHGQINQFVSKTVKVKVDELDEDGTPTGKKISDEAVRRTFPVLDILGDDPDVTLVQALEDLNDDTGEIKPSKFLTDRVLEKQGAAEIATPTDALLTVLNDAGGVNLEMIADRLNISEAEAIEALGTAIYEDPSAGWVTNDEYLSGNVKRKLELAREAAETDRRFERNVTALEANQPEPLSPSQIDPRLGMNWIPSDVYEDFMAEVMGLKMGIEWHPRTKTWVVDSESRSTHHLVNQWGNIEGTYKTEDGAQKAADKKNARYDKPRYFVKAIESADITAATQEWGTTDMPAEAIMETALTGRPIRIEKKDSKGNTAMDPAGTEAAKEKLDQMHAKFASWLFADDKRADRLVSLYNDKFNTNVSRKFDGSHLTLPGTSKQFNVFDHVKRGAWRIMQTGNTYLAHAVGSGKTFQMVISAMEQKRLGLIKKPMVVVPNHMLKQFAQEWQQLYPAARLMVADERNFHTDNRRRFVSRVALSDLDGVILTHSALKLLDLDPEFKTKIIEEELAFFRAALEEAGGNPDKMGGSRDPKIKRIEKQIENMEQKLLAAMSSEGKDKNVRFDELGVDMLYVDEAHEYRKLDFTTNRVVKGLSPMGSERAFDLYMKSRYLESKKPGRSLVLASGTPVTNTIAELYTVQKMLGRAALEEKGIEDFDSWAAMFGREKTTLEPNAAGKYEMVTRFQDFANVADLTAMFREFADVLTSDQLAEMLGDKRPQVEGGARTIVPTPETAEYEAFRGVLEQRMEASKKWKPSKEEPNNPDPIIKIIGDGRLAAIDMRFMDPTLPSNPDSKLNKMIDGVIAAVKETANYEYTDKAGNVEPTKGAATMVFSDLGFGAGVAASRGFNARAWFEKRLRDAKIPEAQIAFMSDYKKSTAKQKLFKDVNAGRVRLLVGSSKNMGTGVNAQQRLKDMFHLDSPWFPADLEQREGRIVRQGNKNKVVRLKAYAAIGTYDQQMWGQLAGKQLFIDKAMSGDPSVRRIEDAGAADMMAMAAGMVARDPRVLQLAGLDAEIGKMQRLYQAHEDSRSVYRGRFGQAEMAMDFNRKRLPAAEEAAKQVQDMSGDKFTAKVGAKAFTERAAWGKALIDAYADLTARGEQQARKIGEISGFDIAFGVDKNLKLNGEYVAKVVLGTPEPVTLLSSFDEITPAGVAMRAQNAITEVARLPAKMRERIAEATATADALRPKLDATFPMAPMLAEKMRERAALVAEMAAPTPANTAPALTGQAQTATENAATETLWGDMQADAAEDGSTDAVVRLSRGTGGGMDTAVLRKLATGIAAKNPRMPKVNVLADPSKAPKALRDYITEQGAENDVDGAMHDGELYLFASGLPDALRAEHVLAEHEAAHFGLRAILGDSLTQAMNLIYANNGAVRKAATEMQRRGKLSNAAAVEEVIVDLPSAQLARLKGWRKVAALARDWLASHGFTAMAGKIGAWLDGTLSDQQRADLFVADLVRGARAYVAGKSKANAGAKVAGTRLSATLADDLAKQEKWLMAEAKERGYKDIEDLLEKNYPVFETLADLWRKKHPEDVLLSRGRAGDQTESAAFKRWFKDSKVVDADGKPLRVYHGTAGNFNAFDAAKSSTSSMHATAYLGHYFSESPDVANDFVPQREDLSTWPRQRGAKQGGNVMPAHLAIANPYEMPLAEFRAMVPSGRSKAGIEQARELRKSLEDRGYDGIHIAGDQSLKDTMGGDEWHAPTWIAFRPEQIKSATGNRGTFDPTNPDIRLSRAAPAQDVATRAEAIIQDRTGGVRPLDAIAQGLTRVTGVERLTGAIYDKAASLLDAVVPEKVKAGVMSDYGLPEAVKDQRTMLQGRQRVQLRKAGSLIEKLATLTRAESRVAYEWMNMDGADPQAYVSMMQGLPEESVAVLQEVQTMIDRLSKDAVRLGQLDPEAFKRNRFAYLRRSYAKHTLEQTKGQKAKRARTIAVLGEQYKGRGLSETAAMSAIKNIAPEWWERKLRKGKADTALKGEKLLRLERRAPSGTGTTPLPGMTGRQPGRVLELAYWPASERLPAKYADWTQAGTWEVRDVKGPNAVLWRDFTKDEREQMGEIDEARFAIAKTLHAMIHDVEVGRYLDWLAMNQAKKEGETIPGEVVDASEKYRDTFAPGEWVRVPDSKIAGTNVLKYGKLAGRYVEGPVWNDLRQMAGGGFQPFGDTYNKVLNLWKMSKTALSPAVHMNNVMSNFVMADWHEVHAAHVSKALRIMLAASDKRGGIADRDAAREILNRYSDSGGDSGSWVTNEISRDQIEPLLASLEREMAATNGGNAETQTGVFAALQHALHLRFPAAFDAAAVSLPGKAVKVAGGALLDAYQAEDDVFRLGAWLAAKEQGATDLEAGKRAKASFLDYNINAPWINAMRKSAWPFLSFTYRAVPMLLETVARKPHKLLKLMALAGGLNALGVMLAGAGGGDEDERKLLPEEKAGNVWGMVPKLIRMPWNDAHDSPVYLDIRRFIPVGDVFDIGQGQSAIPILPGLQPGGPLVVLAEIALNKSAFTGKPITLATDTPQQKAEKFLDHMYKAAAPNVLGLPGTYATTGVVGSLTGRTDAFGREMSTAQAVASSFGVKLGSYPPDVMRRNLMGKFGAEKMEIDKNISQYKRQLQTGRIGQEEFQRLTAIEQDKKRKLQQELSEKLN